MREFASELKVGDKAIVESYGMGASGRVVEVERLTKTQIIFKGHHTRYRRKDGCSIGDASSWNRFHLCEYTEEKALEIARSSLVGTIESKTTRKKLETLTLLELEIMRDIICQ